MNTKHYPYVGVGYGKFVVAIDRNADSQLYRQEILSMHETKDAASAACYYGTEAIRVSEIIQGWREANGASA